MFKFFVFIILLFITLVSYSYGTDCGVYIKETQKAERTVLLMGGRALDLFNAYVQKLKERNLPVKYGAIEVKLWDGKQVKEYKLDWRSWFTGESPVKLWESRLKNVEAKYNNDLLVKAKQYGWDIYCVGVSQSQTQGNVTQQTQQALKEPCPAEVKSHINLGLQFVKSKDYDNAIKEFKEAVRMAPRCPLAYANLANAYLVKKSYNLALETYQEGIKQAGEDGFLHLTGAIIYTYKKDFDLALRALEKALANGFRDVNILKNNADLKPLIKERKSEFCEIMNKYQIILKECL